MKIRERIEKAFLEQKTFQSPIMRNHPDTRLRRLRRDSIRTVGQNPLFEVLSTPYTVYDLWGTTIVKKSNTHIILGAYNYRTVLTKNRLNLVARLYNLPGVYQRKGRWYWQDGIEYAGPRIFNI